MGTTLKYLFSSLCTMLILSGALCQAQELTIITEEIAPFSFTAHGKPTGSSVQVVEEILRRLGRTERIQSMTWARGYKLALTKPNTVLFSTTRIPEREDLFHWVGPLNTVKIGFYALSSSTVRPKTLDDARRVGAIATYKDDVREQLLLGLGFTNLDSSKSPLSNLKKLLAGRVNLWIFDNIGIILVTRQMGIEQETIELVLPFGEISQYIAFSRQTPLSIVRQWQETLDGMKADGTFQRISRRWLPEESIPAGRDTGTGRINPAERMRIFTEDSPPGNYLENGKPRGLSVEIVQEILFRLRRPESIEVVPWARGYRMAMSEPNVALFSTTRLSQREDKFRWVGPLYSQMWGFYARKGSGVRIRNLADARNIARIGTYHKDAKKQYLEALGFDNLISSNINISNVKHLMRAEIDLWVSSDFNVAYLSRQAGVDPERLELAYPFREVHNFIAFSLSTPEAVVHEWQAVLDAIVADGTYGIICDKYDYVPHAALVP